MLPAVEGCPSGANPEARPSMLRHVVAILPAALLLGGAHGQQHDVLVEDPEIEDRNLQRAGRNYRVAQNPYV